MLFTHLIQITVVDLLGLGKIFKKFNFLKLNNLKKNKIKVTQYIPNFTTNTVSKLLDSQNQTSFLKINKKFYNTQNRQNFLNILFRFQLFYFFLSTFYTIRIIISYLISIKEIILSLNYLFNASNWMEREIWDLFGIYFLNHFDLRRILTDYGFTSHPLRKDNSLIGTHEKIFSDIVALVIQKILSIFQENRSISL
jgi:NADH:ubiquinone oxidoreductase subunit C